MRISAPGIMLPEGSTTTPLMVASVDWAAAGLVGKRISSSKQRAQNRFTGRLLKRSGIIWFIRSTRAPAQSVTTIVAYIETQGSRLSGVVGIKAKIGKQKGLATRLRASARRLYRDEHDIDLRNLLRVIQLQHPALLVG